jgi:hypothetical protein
MDEQQAIDFLERGGGGTGAGSPGDRPPKYNGLADPGGAEQLGAALAGRLRDAKPAAIVVWEDPEDVVLGHVVGRELGIPVVRAYDADGLVGRSPGLPEAARAALVADAIRDPRVVLAARAMLERERGSLIATAVLVRTPELDGLEDQAGLVVALVDAPAAEAEPLAPNGAPRHAAR